MTSALGTFRLLLRTCRQTFKGDDFAYTSAVAAIRERFESSRHATGSEREERIAEGREAADFIRSFVVQGKLNERGNYAVKLHSPDPSARNVNVVPDPGTIIAEGPEGGSCGSGRK